MSKKAFRSPRLAPLQRVVAESVTDPEEIAAMEAVYKRIKQIQKRNKPLEIRKSIKKSPKLKKRKDRDS